ncbi:hypothetical protein BC943DRAFT_336327 [Umbelopsis sp. AD052]|nr:hypothetical protein BC943DRAFT_336327 [Umbelopsis sp. AD052]
MTTIQPDNDLNSEDRRRNKPFWDLEDVCENLEDQLKSMDIQFDAKNYTPSIKSEEGSETSVDSQSDTLVSSETEMYGYPRPSCNCIQSTPCPHMQALSSNSSQWNLTISRERQGLRFQTSIKTIEDILVFTAESLKYFSISSDVPRQPLYYSDRREGQLQVTLKRLDGEVVVAQLIRQSRRQHTPLNLESIRPILEKAYYSAITQKILRAYFECDNLSYALVHERQFYNHIEHHSDCMMVPAMCAYMMVNHCQHVMLDGLPAVARKNLELHFASKARSALEDVLFDEKPTVESIWTMMNLARYNLTTLNGSEAWMQIGTAWRMAIALKPDYLDVLHNPHAYDEEMQVTAESWRRLYYYIRYLEVNLHTVFQPTSNYLSVIDDCDLGEPTMNDHDLQDDDHKNAFVVLDRLIKLSVRHLEDNNDNILYALFRGTIDTVSQSSVEKLEHFLCLWWKDLPPQFQLGPSPIQYVPQSSIDECQIPQVLMLNNLYHLFWMAFQCRLMRDPQHADLAATPLHFSNSDRALAIVSICCDAIARCNEALLRLSPCKVDAHYLIIAMDVMSRLQASTDKKIASMAKSNLVLTMRILKSVTHSLVLKGVHVLGTLSSNPQDGDESQTDNQTVGLGQFIGRLTSIYESTAPCT